MAQPSFGKKWDAAALLNPKTTHTNKPAAHSAPPQAQLPSRQQTQTPQLQFEFESPSGPKSPNMNGFAQYANAPQSNGYAQTSYVPPAQVQVGWSHMMNKVHPWVDRSELSQKRRRTNPEQDEPERKKANFVGGGSGGVLGEYMKEKREEGKQEQATNGRVFGSVDLTADDDDEVVAIDDPENVEVCYGRIDHAEVNCHIQPSPKPGTAAINPQMWPTIKVMLKRRAGEATKIIQCVDCTRTCFGCVDVNTAIGLVPILDSNLGVRTVARILTRMRKPDEKQPGQPVSCRYELDLCLYGPRKAAKQIGKHLSQKQIWLRPPFMVDAGIQVCNPHQEMQNMAPRDGKRCLGYAAVTSATARTVEEVRNEVLGMFDNLKTSDKMSETEPGPLIKTQLLQHQKQGLTFMLAREQEISFGDEEKESGSLWKQRISPTGTKTFVNVITNQQQTATPPQVLGGILADMMGLGKTLSILSLIAATKDQKGMKEFISQPPPPPQEDEVLLRVNSRATLLVCPLSTISNWQTQIEEHIVPEGFKFHVYHGAQKCKSLEDLADHDLVITTYGSVASEYSRRAKKPGCFLEEINWFRIVLDEAHMIREQSTQNSKAICRLQAQRRWAVTGTPVQNRLDDLGALLKFLRMKPFDEKRMFAQHITGPFKMADQEIIPKLRLLVDSITLRRLKDRINLPPVVHNIVKLDFTREEQELYDIFAKNAQDRVKVLTRDQEKSLGGKSYVHILQSILRLRLICAHGRDLLSEEDMKLTVGITKDSAIDLEDEDAEPPGLTSKAAYDMYKLMKDTNADNCFICDTQIGRNTPDSESEGRDDALGYLTSCYHLICNGCIKDHKRATLAVSQDHGKHAVCPLCHQYGRTDFFPLKGSEAEHVQDNVEESKNSKGGKKMPPYQGMHTKTRELVRNLLLHQAESRSKPNEPPIKSVVFSGWTSHLNLIKKALDEYGITSCRLDGTMSRKARGDALKEFKDEPTQVMLVSIAAGGLGLNLTTANKVYVMEPQYNPAAEAQAIDRVHRLGQTRAVETVRFIMRDSFEEKMLELQQKKRDLANLSLDDKQSSRGMGKAEATKKRLEDLRSLFK